MQASQESIADKLVTIRPNENPNITCHVKQVAVDSPYLDFAYLE